MISFRPHHFLCTLGFKGLGYSSKFIKNYHSIKKQLLTNEDTGILVTFKDDSICKSCPNLISKDFCKFQAKIEALDKLHIDALSLKDEEIISWADAKLRIKQKVSLEKFHIICSSCEWKALGICEEALKKLIDQ
jgi:hypothetical protein